MNQYMELLDKPFIRNRELAQLLNVSASTVSKMIKQYELKKYPWGFSTDEIIKKLSLEKYISRQKKKAPIPTKV